MAFIQLILYALAFLGSLFGCMGYEDTSVELNDDVLGLIVFKSDLDDPSVYLDSWNEDENFPCSWKYIQCDSSTGRVSEVSLDGLGLSGRIGRGLQKLQHLKVLSLSHNNFSGTISPELGLIGSLERLNLSHNSLSGSIPGSLLSTNSIKFLDLSGNLLSGAVPDNLFQNCSSLRYLSLAENFLQGPLPSTLARCTSLNTLNVSRNHFSGNPNFASSIWALTRLRTLDISHNVFSGNIPNGVASLHNLKRLILQRNQLTGALPADIGLCLHLDTLDLSHNLFTGLLPDSLGGLNSMAYFSLSDNMLTGNLPIWIGNMSNLVYLDFSSNSFTGGLPLTMGNLRSLNFLSLSNNRLTGNIPTSLAYCSQLSVLRLAGNTLSGIIPRGLFELGLEEADLSNNVLAGAIPPGSNRLFQSLRRLDLSQNNLSGSIQAEMGLFANMRYLNLSWNNLQSRIPPELGFFQNLTILDLRNSALHGTIPGDICESGSLAILQLDENSLAGPIPEEFGNCSSLDLLSLSHNNLSGPIPISISNLDKLKILKLEFNELSGDIPPELGKLENLLAVNISFNRLIGKVPAEGVFPSLDQSALQGNLGLCSPLLKGPCIMNVPKPLVIDPYTYNNQINGHRQRNESSDLAAVHHGTLLSVSAIIAISAAILIASGVVIVTLLNASARRRLAFVDNALESMCSSSSRSGSLQTGKLILFDSRTSPTSFLNPENLLNNAAEIGEGAFGTVYKVSLGAQRGTVAIKKLVTSNIIQYPEDFDREVRILGKARHPNLISVAGYYWTPQLQLLVAEYATNGNLHVKLHEKLGHTPPLSWANRFKIILGTAKGLAHLHHSFRPPIIHYNIKPSNILLDENYNAKISDFGLARLLTKLEKHVISNRFQSALGYVAPELACQSLRVNEKCDVYGFGVLVLEIVTGRRAVEYGEDNVVILRDHIRALHEQGNILEYVDPSMGEYPEEEVLPILKLAHVCTDQIPSGRPSMAEVVQILQVIKTPVPHRVEIF